MIVKHISRVYHKATYSDGRYVGRSGFMCLCRECAKSAIVQGRICFRHEVFVRTCNKLSILAPVLECPYFVQSTAVRGEDHVKSEWKAEQRLWNMALRGTILLRFVNTGLEMLLAMCAARYAKRN